MHYERTYRGKLTTSYFLLNDNEVRSWALKFTRSLIRFSPVMAAFALCAAYVHSNNSFASFEFFTPHWSVYTFTLFKLELRLPLYTYIMYICMRGVGIWELNSYRVECGTLELSTTWHSPCAHATKHSHKFLQATLWRAWANPLLVHGSLGSMGEG